jgi:hypothetical protein
MPCVRRSFRDESQLSRWWRCFWLSRPRARDENVWFARTLDEAARLACLLARWRVMMPATTGGVIRGLYTGGTLAAEAAGLLASHLGVAPDAHHHGMMLNATGIRSSIWAMIFTPSAVRIR